MSLRRPVALAAAASLALAGCGLRDRIQPTTTGTSTPDPGSSQGSEGEDLGTLTGSGRPLDEGGLRAALPSADEVGDGWGEDPVTTVTETQSADVTPSTCAPLLQKGPGWDSVRATQRARVQTNLRRTDNPQPPGTERHHMGVWAYSFDDPYPSQLFDEAGQTITDCAGFDVKQRDTGNTSSYEAEPLAFPTLGDRTLAMRLTVRQTMETFTIDFVVIKIGHNTVTIANGTYNGTPDSQVTESAARAAVDGLEQS